jgi:hypothetical protein
MKKNILLFSFVISILACTKMQMIGHWQGDSATIAGQAMEGKFQNIHLNLDKNGAYEYSATDGYLERGWYRIDGNFFFTNDTLNKKQEKMIEIDKVNSEKLVLKMKNIKGEEEFLTLKKVE